jgi:hypothetical protein
MERIAKVVMFVILVISLDIFLRIALSVVSQTRTTTIKEIKVSQDIISLLGKRFAARVALKEGIPEVQHVTRSKEKKEKEDSKMKKTDNRILIFNSIGLIILFKIKVLFIR